MSYPTRLVIARHGNTFGPGDVVTRVGGRTDLPLVEKGLEQGRHIGLYLKTHNLIPDAIFTSPLKRTMQTAEQAQAVMGTSLPIQQLDFLREIDYGPDENHPEEEVVARLGKDALEAWDKQGIVPSGWKVDPNFLIKSWLEFGDKIAKDYLGKTVLVVTSNGIARFAPYITGDFAGFSAKHSIKLATGALCLLEKQSGNSHWECRFWNIK